MSNEHRKDQVAKALVSLQTSAQTFLELFTNVQTMLAQIAMWGGVGPNDFGVATDTTRQAQSRLDETLAALSAANIIMAALDNQVPDFNVTIKQALLRIAERK